MPMTTKELFDLIKLDSALITCAYVNKAGTTIVRSEKATIMNDPDPSGYVQVVTELRAPQEDRPIKRMLDNKISIELVEGTRLEFPIYLSFNDITSDPADLWEIGYYVCGCNYDGGCKDCQETTLFKDAIMQAYALTWLEINKRNLKQGQPTHDPQAAG